MDQSQTRSEQASLSLREPEGAAYSSDQTRAHALRPVAGGKAPLTLVRTGLTFARPDEGVPAVWGEAIEALTQELGIEADWVANGSSETLLQKARRAVGAGSQVQAPIFAPWRVTSPTLFQTGQPFEAATGAKWVASYLFDFGPACSANGGSVDVALMSPCPEVCVSDDAQIGALPRLSVLAEMMRAAAAQGRTNLAVVVREAARATLATRLLGFDMSLNALPLEVEFISIEEAVMDIQSGAFDWDAVMAMPDLRGIVFAMLAQNAGVSGAWPMLWFDRGQALRLVTREALTGVGVGANQSSQLDATALLQALSLLARHTGHQYAARRFYESWAAMRERGIVTALRGSSAPYVNQIDEAAYIDQAIRDPASQKRPLPSWKGLAGGESDARKAEPTVRLSLVT
ncbi:MAG: hypothetical protein AAFO28_00565 [Pseudomonadota bacterium]